MDTADRTNYLVLDQGGHAGRATVYDRAGGVVSRGERTVATTRPGPGRVEQDAEEVLDSLTGSIDEALVKARLDPGHLTAAGLACQRSSVVCWDAASGRALTPVLSWQDTRGAHLFAGAVTDPAAVAARTGLPPVAHYGATKLAWCLGNEPAVRDAFEAGTLRWGPLASFLLDRLLEERPYRTNHTIAQRTLLFDLGTLDWSGALAQSFGIPVDSLPRCVPDRSLHGHLRVGETRVPFEACAGDQNTLPFAFGPAAADTAWLNAGTGAFLLRMLPGGASPGEGLLRTLVEGHDGVPAFAAEGTVNGAGAAFDWYVGRTGRDIPWETLDGLEPSEELPLFLNAVGDLGSPFWTTGVEPAFEPTEPPFEQALVAITESIAFLVRANTERMPGVARVCFTGGLSRSGLLCRLLASSLDAHVERVVETDMTSRGVLALLTGEPAHPAGAAEPFAPEPGLSRLLDARYLRWRRAVDQAIQRVTGHEEHRGDHEGDRVDPGQ